MDSKRNYAAWVKVSSSNVDAVVWHEDRDTGRPVLGVRFLSSPKEYDFLGVPEDVYHAFINAPSKGKFFNREIKDEFYCPQAKKR